MASGVHDLVVQLEAMDLMLDRRHLPDVIAVRREGHALGAPPRGARRIGGPGAGAARHVATAMPPAERRSAGWPSRSWCAKLRRISALARQMCECQTTGMKFISTRQRLQCAACLRQRRREGWPATSVPCGCGAPLSRGRACDSVEACLRDGGVELLGRTGHSRGAEPPQGGRCCCRRRAMPCSDSAAAALHCTVPHYCSCPRTTTPGRGLFRQTAGLCLCQATLPVPLARGSGVGRCGQCRPHSTLHNCLWQVTSCAV